MKRLLVVLVLGLLFPIIAHSQDMNLEKMSQADREKCLFEIAIAAMKKYAPSYYKEDIKPVIGYEGIISDKEDKDYNRKTYRIDFPFDLRKSIGDNREGENVYGGQVGIRGTGKVDNILPAGWVVVFDIDEANEIRTRSGEHKVAEPTKVPKNPFKTE